MTFFLNDIGTSFFREKYFLYDINDIIILIIICSTLMENYIIYIINIFLLNSVDTWPIFLNVEDFWYQFLEHHSNETIKKIKFNVTDNNKNRVYFVIFFFEHNVYFIFMNKICKILFSSKFFFILLTSAYFKLLKP